MRVYIAGPMTGYPDLNRPAFAAAQEALTARGYQAVNPTGIDQGRPYLDLLRESLVLMLSCNAICMLEGWMASRGARLEHVVATSLEFEIVSLEPRTFGNGESFTIEHTVDPA